jgi:hypothetical protein
MVRRLNGGKPKLPICRDYGEGRGRTADTTIFSQGIGAADLAVDAGTFLNDGDQELPVVSRGFWGIVIMRAIA